MPRSSLPGANSTSTSQSETPPQERAEATSMSELQLAALLFPSLEPRCVRPPPRRLLRFRHTPECLTEDAWELHLPALVAAQDSATKRPTPRTPSNTQA